MKQKIIQDMRDEVSVIESTDVDKLTAHDYARYHQLKTTLEGIDSNGEY